MSTILTLRKLKTLWHSLKSSIDFLWNLQGIVFFGGYPYVERQSDGYFQRTQMVDRLFKDCWRIYVEGEYLDGHSNWLDRPEENVFVLRIAGKPFQRLLAQVCAILCVLRCRRIYFHSVLTMLHKRIGWLLYMPGITRVIDVHGAVTEEFRLHNDFYRAMLYEPVESLAIRKCDVIIVVTKAMENYLRQKYREDLRGRFILFPMFPNYPLAAAPRRYVNGKPVIVYAGGLQKWQQIPKMVDAVRFTRALYAYRFYCPEPFKIREMLPESTFSEVVIEYKTRDELSRVYPECHYGFILREESIVNQVACPTKLVEYLAMGIVPIINSENIGDFQFMGMQSVSLDALLYASLPDEEGRMEMVRLNFELYRRLEEMYKEGSYQLRTLLSDKSRM
jgi:hypothetical protein